MDDWWDDHAKAIEHAVHVPEDDEERDTFEDEQITVFPRAEADEELVSIWGPVSTRSLRPVSSRSFRPVSSSSYRPSSYRSSRATVTTEEASTSSQTSEERVVISFDRDDPEHPNNWNSAKKNLVLAAGIASVINSTIGSSLSSGAVTFIIKEFKVTSEIQVVLPISCYLLGYVVGPVICGPLSENFGRKPIMLITFCLYIIFTMACAVAPNWPALLVFRFFCGLWASAPIAVVGGLFADIHSDPRKRGVIMALFMAATTTGPVIAPVLSGFIAENVSWRWVFAVGTFMALGTLPLIVLMPETHIPILLRRRAAKIRKETGEDVIAKTDLQQKSLKYLLTVVMTLPYRMLFQELIVACVCAYTALAYAIFYLFFEAYPLIFQGPTSVYGWSPGLSGLAFMPIGIGTLVCGGVFVWWDSYLAKARARGAAWTKQEEYRRLPLACIGGPLYVIALFWLGWSAREGVHWIAPVLSGLLFGMGSLLILMALLNYLADAYKTFAASAMGISSTTRSIFGALLPLAANSMFKTLGINWACSLLAFLSLGMAVIPFAFIKWGDTIRARSKFCQQLKAMEEEAAAAKKPDEKGGKGDEREQKTNKSNGKTEHAKSEKSKSERTKSERSKTEKSRTEKPTSEKPKSEKPKSEKPKTEKPKTEKPRRERTKTERVKTGKA